MLDSKELEQALQCAGPLASKLEDFFANCYGRHSDFRYQRARYSTGLAKFTEAVPGAKKLAITRAPGRVTLLGDYSNCCNLPSLSMAIERDIVIICAPRKDRRVNLINTSFWFPPRSFDVSSRIRPYASGNWGNFAKAAAQALQKASNRPLKGMDACVMGDIPSDSGLAGASALVVATMMALASVNNFPIDNNGMVELLDQIQLFDNNVDMALPLMAEAKMALKVDCFPAGIAKTVIPDDFSFVICNSLVSPERQTSSKEQICRREIECKVGASLIGKSPTEPGGLQSFAALRSLPAETELQVVDALPEGGLSTRDLARLLGISQAKFRESYLKLIAGGTVSEPKTGFKIRQRVRHVLTEARRVERAALAAGAGDAVRLGDLMNQSHSSCTKDWEATTPEIDKLAEICREEGALGSRLTGSGFGGCVIALVRDRDLPDFMAAIISRYYNDYLLNGNCNSPLSTMSLENAIFPCKPSGPAAILM